MYLWCSAAEELLPVFLSVGLESVYLAALVLFESLAVPVKTDGREREGVCVIVMM